MKKEIDIHNYPRRLEMTVKQVEKALISNKNRAMILEFKDYCSINNLSLPRIIRYLGILKDWAKILNKDFDKATKNDIMKAVLVVQEKDYSPWTKSTYKIMLKRFYKWVKKTGEDYPEEVKWMKTRVKVTEMKQISSSELITEEEVKKLIDIAEHPRDKAFVGLLYESGARVGELASLQIENIKFDEQGVKINLNGKTGPRIIKVYFSSKYLMNWMEIHPMQDDCKAPLWINFGSKQHHKPLRYDNIRFMLKKLFLKAGIKKRFNPHMFRHSRATFMASHLNEFQMNQYFGWRQGSDMASTYVHMSGKDLDSAVMAMNGIKPREKIKESVLKLRVCPRCSAKNNPGIKLCYTCTAPLDINTSLEVEEKLAKKDKFYKAMELLMENKKFVNFLDSMMDELKLGGDTKV